MSVSACTCTCTSERAREHPRRVEAGRRRRRRPHGGHNDTISWTRSQRPVHRRRTIQNRPLLPASFLSSPLAPRPSLPVPSTQKSTDPCTPTTLHPSPFPPNRKFPSNPAIFFESIESKIPPYLLIAHRPVEHVHGPIQQLHIRPLCTQIQYLKHLRFRFRGHGRLDCSRISRIRSGRRDQRPPTRGGQRRTTSGSWYGVGVYETNARRSKRRAFRVVFRRFGTKRNFDSSPIASRVYLPGG